MTRRLRLSLASIPVALVVSTASPIVAQPFVVETAKLTGADTVANDRFGFSLDVNVETLVVGAINHDAQGDNAGAVYVFERDADTWIQAAKIVAPDGAPGDWFGYAVAVDSGVIAAGAQYADTNGVDAGAVYLFRESDGSWFPEAKIVPDDLAAGDLLGHAIAIHGSVLAISAERHDAIAQNAGAVYMYRFDGSSWMPDGKLTASDGTANDFFGHALSVYDDIIVIGAERKRIGGQPNAGAAYVFEYDSPSQTWIEQARLVAPDFETDAFFGHWVAFEDPWIAVGAAFADANGEDSGSAYLYERTSRGSYPWIRTILPADGGVGDQFGSSVALRDNALYVGAERADATGIGYHLALRDGRWVPVARLRADAVSIDARLGRAIGVAHDSIVIGAYEDDERGPRAGAVFVFPMTTRPPITISPP